LSPTETIDPVDGTTTYECCPKQGFCPLPNEVREDPCAFLQSECISNDPTQMCLPRCLRTNQSTGQTLVLECTCRDVDGCHVVPGFEGPICLGECPPGMTCIQTQSNFTDPVTGITYVDDCCDCEMVCPPQESAPGDLCAYFQTHSRECVDGSPDDTCLPQSVDIYGGPGSLYPIATECTCGPCGLVSTWTIPPSGNPFVHALSCGGGCSPPAGATCTLFKNGNPIGTNISVLISGLLVGDTIRCDCPPTCSAPCNDGLFCNGCETSNPNTGACQPGDPPCPAEFDCDEDQDTCVESPVIPTVSEWGLVVLTLLLLIGAKIYFSGRETATAL